MLILNVDDDINDREMFLAAVTAIDPDLTYSRYKRNVKNYISILSEIQLAADINTNEKLDEMTAELCYK